MDVSEVGALFSLVYCSYDLQDFHADYKSGHSHVRTSIGYLKDTPRPNDKVFKRSLNAKDGDGWSEATDMRLPFAAADAATCAVNGDLYVVGGSVIKYDEDLQIFYQSPTKSTWVFSFANREWRRGPDLPCSGCTKGTLFLSQGSNKSSISLL